MPAAQRVHMISAALSKATAAGYADVLAITDKESSLKPVEHEAATSIMSHCEESIG